MEELILRVKNAHDVATMLHEPTCDLNAARDGIMAKTYSGILCSIDDEEVICAVLSWRGLVDTKQIVAIFSLLTVNEQTAEIVKKENKLCNLYELAEELRGFNHPITTRMRKYTQNPDQVRKECRMKFDVCRKHDATIVFVQILLLSNNYFVQQ